MQDSFQRPQPQTVGVRETGGTLRRRLRLPVTTWNQLAGKCATHLTRGRHVAVSGRLDHNEFTGHDGKKRDRWEITATAVTFLDAPPEGVAESSAQVSGRRLSAVAGSAG